MHTHESNTESCPTASLLHRTRGSNTRPYPSVSLAEPNTGPYLPYPGDHRGASRTYPLLPCTTCAAILRPYLPLPMSPRRSVPAILCFPLTSSGRPPEPASQTDRGTTRGANEGPSLPRAEPTVARVPLSGWIWLAKELSLPNETPELPTLPLYLTRIPCQLLAEVIGSGG